MRWMVRTLLLVSAIGAADSIHRQRPARFAGLRLPGSATQHALTIGSPLSAPPLMLAALVAADRRGRTDLVRLLAAMFIIGILGEIDTWADLSDPTAAPIATACAAAYVLLPAGMIYATSRTRGCIPRPRPAR